MKTILLITQIFIGSSILGQGNLQFNRAVHTELSCSNATGINYSTVGATVSVIVPTGKTLKITSAFITNTIVAVPSRIVTNSYDSQLILDASPLAYCEYGNSENFIPTNMFPIWLPSGTYSLKITYSTNNNPANYYQSKAYISGVEFNIIP